MLPRITEKKWINIQVDQLLSSLKASDNRAICLAHNKVYFPVQLIVGLAARLHPNNFLLNIASSLSEFLPDTDKCGNLMKFEQALTPNFSQFKEALERITGTRCELSADELFSQMEWMRLGLRLRSTGKQTLVKDHEAIARDLWVYQVLRGKQQYYSAQRMKGIKEQTKKYKVQWTKTRSHDRQQAGTGLNNLAWVVAMLEVYIAQKPKNQDGMLLPKYVSKEEIVKFFDNSFKEEHCCGNEVTRTFGRTDQTLNNYISIRPPSIHTLFRQLGRFNKG